MFLFLVSIIFILFFSCLISASRPHSYPPGPPYLPLLGNIVSLWLDLKTLKNYHSVWKSWSKKYGNLVGLKLGGINVVVVFGKDLIKEVSSMEVFEGRPNGFFYLIRSFGKKLGIAFSEGPTWSATRRVVLKYLKSFGYGSRSMENNIIEECKAFVKLRLEDAGSPVVVNGLLDISVVNILWRLVAGKRYDLKDEQLKRLWGLVSRSFKVVNMSGGLLNFLPGLRHVVPGLIGYTELRNIHEEIYVFIKKTIAEHRSDIDVSCPRDVIDALLIDIMENKIDSFTEEHLQVVCLDLLEAGVETITNSLEFTLLHVMLNPGVQRRLHEEIDAALAQGTHPTLPDRGRMMYTEAVVLEGLRISSVPAVGIPHTALQDATLDNYVIPKGTFLLLAMHDLHNGEHWKDPEVFRPERFLTKEGNLIQDEWLMPFGTGRRRCIGEGLARAELFLFLTHILQRFTLSHPPPDPTPSTQPIDGVSLSPRPFRLLFEPRF